ncbi:MAG: protein kinase [Acidobacteriota bacterium]
MTGRFAETEAHPLLDSRPQGGPSEAPLGRVRNIVLSTSLGKGGMGEVFIGEDEVLGRRVAVKCIRPGLLNSKSACDRFLREARLLSQLEHPNICRVYDFITTSDGDYLVMELVEGRSLEEAAPDLDFNAKLRIVMQIATALSVAHRQGIVHRDLKPQNVMIDARGDAKVLDFGLARRWDEDSDEAEVRDGPESQTASQLGPGFETEAGSVLGSPAYMSPEQARGETVTPGSDLYSLGLLLQELVEGARAYEAEGLPVLIAKVQLGDARPMADGDPDLIDLVEGLKALDPGARPSAEAVYERLRSILDKPRRRRNRIATVAAATILLLGAVKYTVDLRRERQLAVKAQSRAETLIDFMVDDLYRGLEPLGRLDLLEAAADAARGYYDEFGSHGGDVDRWFGRARALRNSGRVLEYQGKYEKASLAYRQSAESLTGLIAALEAHPESEDWRRALAETEALLGRALQEQGKLNESFELRARALQLRRQLEAGASPERQPELRLERFKEQAELAWLLREMHRHEEALRELDAILGEAEDAPGDLRRFLSVILSYRGTTESERGRLPRALADFSRARDLDLELWREHRDPGRQLNLLMSTSQIGETLAHLERGDEAVEAFSRARDLAEELVARDPLNADWKRELAVTHTNLAAAWREQGRFDASLEASRAALELSRELLAGDPTNASYRNDVAADLTAVGVALEGLGELTAARDAWQQAVDLLEPALSGLDEASSYYVASLAEAQLRLGRLDQASRPLAVLAARGWNDPTLETLARELGWRPPEPNAE